MKRPVVELRHELMVQLETALAQNPVILALLAGIYEGRGLQGDYDLKLAGARLVPKENRNGATPKA